MRTIRYIAIGMALMAFVLVIFGGFVYILTGGDVVNFAQTAVIRLSLLSRQDDLDRTVSADDSPVRFTVVSGDTPQMIADGLYPFFMKIRAVPHGQSKFGSEGGALQ